MLKYNASVSAREHLSLKLKDEETNLWIEAQKTQVHSDENLEQKSWHGRDECISPPLFLGGACCAKSKQIGIELSNK